MKRIDLASALCLLAMLVLIPACSSDDGPANPGGGDTNEPPAQTTLMEAMAPQLPSGLTSSSSPQAQTITTQVGTFATQLNSWLTIFGEPTGEPSYEKNGTWTWTWTWGQAPSVITLQLQVSETDTAYTWQMTISGTLDGSVLTDFVFYEAYARKDGSEGYVRLRDPEQDTAETWDVVWEWETAQNQTYTMALTSLEDSRLEVVINADGSGSISAFDWNGSQWAINFMYTWSAAGSSGTFVVYDEDGDPVSTDDWSDIQ